MNTEAWKPMAGWEDAYEVSSEGRVRSIPRFSARRKRTYGGEILQPIVASNGYLVVNLKCGARRKQVAIHRAVLEAFRGVAPPGCQACHNNGIKSDPRLDNLRWDTVAANHADKIIHGTRQCGERNAAAKLTAAEVSLIRESDMPDAYWAERFDVGVGAIQLARTGLAWDCVQTPPRARKPGPPKGSPQRGGVRARPR